MEHWLQPDWPGMFVMEMSLPEILIRGTLVYLSLCLLLRVILKRQAGKVSLSDLLVVALVAGVCRNPLVRDTKSIPDGLLVVAMILFWSYAMDWLSFYSPFVHKLLHTDPVPLVRNGQVLHENLRRELMTEHQLNCKLRREGARDPSEVAESWLEGDGHVSVIKKKEDPVQHPHEGDARLIALRPPPEDKHPPNRVSRLRGEDRGAVVSTPSPPEEPDAEVTAFLNSAKHLQEKIAWHEQQIDQHQQCIAEVKEILTRHGFRIGMLRKAEETQPKEERPPQTPMERNGRPSTAGAQPSTST
jgi:uncharacterized membrane protein YcaP (DUF421 family)